MANRKSLTPYETDHLRFPCRIAVAPMSRTRASDAGIVGPESCNYYTRYACAGVGGIVSEALAIGTGVEQAYFFQAGISSEEHTGAWRNVTAAVATHGVPFFAQLQHAGRLVEPGLHKTSPIAPVSGAAQGNSWQRGLIHPGAEAATPQDLLGIAEKFRMSAAFAQRAGFTGIELHAARGYLLHQFLLKHSNTRTDRYGGNVASRLRILEEIVRAVRVEVGASMPISVNFSLDRMDVPQFVIDETETEFGELIVGICSLDVDFLHFSTRDHASTELFGRNAIEFVANHASKPIITGGNVRGLSQADHLLSIPGVELVAVGRSLLSNPDWIGRKLNGLPLLRYERGMHLQPVGNEFEAFPQTERWPVFPAQRPGS